MCFTDSDAGHFKHSYNMRFEIPTNFALPQPLLGVKGLTVCGVMLPANDHGAEHWSPASIQHIMSEVISVRDVNPDWKNEKETQTDDRCNPVMSSTFSICHKRTSKNY